MRRLAIIVAFVAACGIARADFSGNVAVEAVTFPNDPKFDEQYEHNTTLSFEPRWEGEWNDGDDLWSVEFFMRVDDEDDNRNHADLREALWLHLDGDNEWRVGVNTMFWGVVESQHLVDVINQVDGVEGLDGEEKLGQPMIHLKRYQDWGVLDFLVLPGFRERTFRDEAGRPRLNPPVDTDAVEYESSAGENHIDYAIRYSNSFDDLEFGIAWFDGTRRDPLLFPGVDDDGEAVLIPYYEQMTQIGIDAQLFYLDWTWRMELIHRRSDSAVTDAFVYGGEYTFYGVFDSVADIGTLVEFSYDNSPEGLRGFFDRDLFLALRFALNDEQSSEMLAGVFIDTEKYSRSLRVEASRRLGDSWRLELELQTFTNIDEQDPLIAFEDDDFLLVELAYYF